MCYRILNYREMGVKVLKSDDDINDLCMKTVVKTAKVMLWWN